MTDNNKNDPAKTRIIGLSQVKHQFGIDPEVVLRQAIAGEVELCAWIPDGCIVFNVDPASLQIAHPSYLVPMSEFEHRFPRQFDGKPSHPRMPIHLVTISRLACREILPQPILESPMAEPGKAPLAPSIPTGKYSSPQTTQTIFKSAYGLVDGDCDEVEPYFVRVSPKRPVLEFLPTPNDEAQWCFAIYPSDENFNAGGISFSFPGYQAPLDLLLSVSSLCIAESEVMRILISMQTPLLTLMPGDDSKVPDVDSPAPTEAAKGNELNVNQVPAKAISKSRVKVVPENIVESVEYVVVHSERKPPTRFLSIDEVTRRFNDCTPQTIYDWLKRSSPRYKPDFPTQVPLGNGSVGWVENEIERYSQSLVDQRCEPQKKPIPKRKSKKKKDGDG